MIELYDPPDLPVSFVLVFVILLGALFFFCLYHAIKQENEEKTKPTYVIINDEQFERIIEALKESEAGE